MVIKTKLILTKLTEIRRFRNTKLKVVAKVELSISQQSNFIYSTLSIIKEFIFIYFIFT